MMIVGAYERRCKSQSISLRRTSIKSDLAFASTWVVNDNLTFSFSWIHDLYTHYRMASDYFYLNTYISF
jgi:hypothetical protein